MAWCLVVIPFAAGFCVCADVEITRVGFNVFNRDVTTTIHCETDVIHFVSGKRSQSGRCGNICSDTPSDCSICSYSSLLNLHVRRIVRTNEEGDSILAIIYFRYDSGWFIRRTCIIRVNNAVVSICNRVIHGNTHAVLMAAVFRIGKMEGIVAGSGSNKAGFVSTCFLCHLPCCSLTVIGVVHVVVITIIDISFTYHFVFVGGICFQVNNSCHWHQFVCGSKGNVFQKCITCRVVYLKRVTRARCVFGPITTVVVICFVIHSCLRLTC